MRKYLSVSRNLCLLLLLPLFLGACNLFDKDEPIPAYISIDSISVSTDYVTQGSASNKITDAWVYVDDQLIGTFELPATFPVITSEGNHSIKIRGGIKLNGIAATRVPYPFYDFYTTTANLSLGKITKMNPVVKYFPGVTFKWIEDFEGAGFTLIDTFADAKLKIANAPYAFEGLNSVSVKLNNDTVAFQARSTSSYNLQQGANSKFLELNYKCNNSFVVGIVYNNTIYPVVGLNPSDNWNKVYINLTDQITVTGNYYIYFGMQKLPGINYSPFLYLDNIKLIHN